MQHPPLLLQYSKGLHIDNELLNWYIVKQAICQWESFLLGLNPEEVMIFFKILKLYVDWLDRE